VESCKLAFSEIIRLRFVETQYVYLDYFSQFSNLRSRQQAADRIKTDKCPIHQFRLARLWSIEINILSLEASEIGSKWMIRLLDAKGA